MFISIYIPTVLFKNKKTRFRVVLERRTRWLVVLLRLKFPNGRAELRFGSLRGPNARRTPSGDRTGEVTSQVHARNVYCFKRGESNERKT